MRTLNLEFVTFNYQYFNFTQLYTEINVEQQQQQQRRRRRQQRRKQQQLLHTVYVFKQDIRYN
jgi:hypothetical protein